MSRIVIIGGGPAGYEAALVAAQLDADVTVVEADGAGGACVLSDCVPSKTFIASSEVVTGYRDTEEFGVHSDGLEAVTVDARAVHGRVKRLALAQSADIHAKLVKAGVTFVAGTARLGEDTLGHTHRVVVTPADGGEEYSIDASTVLVATGATPRQLPTAVPDGERILTWRQVYDLPELPEHLIVVGSGVTGAEFASAYLAMGVEVTLVSSRDRVMPHEDADAAIGHRAGVPQPGHEHPQQLPGRRGPAYRATASRSSSPTAARSTGSHALIAVGSIPNTADLGLAEYGVELGRGGYVTVDRVSRTNVPGIYAAGDCTGRAAAGQRRRHAGPDRDVARARRGGPPAAAAYRRGERLHRPGAGHRRRLAGRGGRRQGAGPAGDAAAVRQRPGQDGRPRRRLREAVLPARPAAR